MNKLLTRLLVRILNQLDLDQVFYIRVRKSAQVHRGWTTTFLFNFVSYRYTHPQTIKILATTFNIFNRK